MNLAGHRIQANQRARPAGIRAGKRATAVSQLPYTGAEIAEWLFNQEKATLENAENCTGIVKPLKQR